MRITVLFSLFEFCTSIFKSKLSGMQNLLGEDLLVD